MERRLRAEAADARVEPSPGLRRRTIAALNDAAPAPAASTALPRPAGPAYALACAALLTLGVLAGRIVMTGPAPIAPQPAPRAVLATFETKAFDALISGKLQAFESSWESTLRTEARLIADDARNAGEFVLAALPLPTTWSSLVRPGG